MVLIPCHRVRIEEFVFEGFQSIVVQGELHFEGPIRYTTPLS